MNSASKLQKLCAAALALSAFSSARAVTFCVNDLTTLKSALSGAQLNTQTPFLLKIVQGTYLMDADVFTNFANPATIEGGYTAGCASRIVNPANTVINIGLGHDFQWGQGDASPQALLAVDGLTFTNSNRPIAMGAGTYNFIQSNLSGSLRISRVRFTAVSSADPIRLTAIDNDLLLENVLFDHLSTSDTCAVTINAIGQATARINHMTADLAGSNDFCFYDGGNATQFSIYNSVLWNSGGGQAFFHDDANTPLTSGTSLNFVNDVFAGTFTTGANSLINQINSDPGWISPATGNYRLKTAPLSPAINSATPVVPGGEPTTDIEGNARWFASAPDRGAYELLFSDQAVFTVTNTLDAGAGSLREAITLANLSSAVGKQINFNITDNVFAPICPAVISLNSSLPNINGRMTIDGYTQPTSTVNTSTNGFNAKLCVLIKPTSGTLASLLTVPANSFGSLTLRGVGIGGFSQPVRLLGGQNSVLTGNQLGASQGGVALPGAGLNAISVGSSASGVLIGGINLADRNFINGAGTSGIDSAASTTAAGSCQIVGNVISANNFGINNTGSGCQIVGNYIYGNAITNLWLNGSNNNIVQRNIIGPNFSNLSVSGNTAAGILLSGTASGNVIGAGGQGGSFTANTVRFNNGGGVVVKGDAALNNSINANVIYDNGSAANAMDIDLSPTGAASVGVGIATLTANDMGDGDSGPNQLQNFPVPVSLGYTGNGTGASMVDRPGVITVTLDSQPGTHRIDAYFTSVANQLGLQGRGHGEVYLGHRDVFALFPAPVTFTMPVSIPTQLSSGVISFTATDANGNTSEIGTGLSIVAPLIDDVFKNGLE
jgi:trimeric autotransporter adhesin